MQFSIDPSTQRVVVGVKDAAEEAAWVYDLVQSGRLGVDNRDMLPLPFRGRYLYQIPGLPRPIEIQIGRLEATPAQVDAGHPALILHVHCPGANSDLLVLLSGALQNVPPASAEELKKVEANHLDEYARIRQMNFAQRIIYATRAGQTGRAVLIQQPTPLLLLYVVKNPLITLPELIAIAKLPSIDSLVAETLVRMVRSNPQLGMSEELKMALATNVKTPPGTAVSLLRHIGSKSLRKVAKSDVSSTVKNAALKILLERRD